MQHVPIDIKTPIWSSLWNPQIGAVTINACIAFCAHIPAAFLSGEPELG